MLPLSHAVARQHLGRAVVVWSDAACVVMSAEMPAVTPSGPILGLAMSRGEERVC